MDLQSTLGTLLSRDGQWLRVVNEVVTLADRVRIGGHEVSIADLLLQLQDHPDLGSLGRDKIFISYRRSDTEHFSGRLYDELAETYGAGHVFFDTEGIPDAVHFPRRIEAEIEASSSLVAVIGPRWLQEGAFVRWLTRSGLLKRTDFVRMELEFAITRRVPIVPVLVGDAQMPDPKMLPAPLRAISQLNAVRVRAGRDFRTDVKRVIDVLDRYRVAIS